MIKKLLALTTIYTLFVLQIFAQSTEPKIPQMRQLFHDNIIATQQKILALSSTKDSIYITGYNEDVNLYATYILKQKVKEIRLFIESNTAISDADKFNWLRSVNELLSDYWYKAKAQTLKPTKLPSLILAYEQCMYAELSKESISPILEEIDVDLSQILLANSAFQKNAGFAEGKNIIVQKIIELNPQKTMQILHDNPNLPTADTLIVAYAQKNPSEVYDYASANDVFGAKIRAHKNPLVSTIAKMAATKQGRFFFPFLDEIMLGNTTLDALTKIADDEEAYYKQLVKTELNYAKLKTTGYTPLSADVLSDKLKAKAIEVYVNVINGLHDENNPKIRFAKIAKLTIPELYYLVVMSEEEMYTSSFISGVYPKIMEQLGKSEPDTIFKMVHFDRYRKFIKMCAGYNTLDAFLEKIDKRVAENLMRKFVDGNTLEDAVDVADSYASIKDKNIKRIINDEVNINLAKSIAIAHKQQVTIFKLLQQLFYSFDAAEKNTDTDLSNFMASYNLPSVYVLPNQELQDTTKEKRIYAQQFFYGDKDGLGAFNWFVNHFKEQGWKVVNKPDWVEVSSTSGTPITIFSNRALDETKGLDDLAQQRLLTYLDSLNIYPSIVIHRGHSYYVNNTIKQLTSSAKLVLLGSCGGYHSLTNVLNICPKAHIIASKQVGTGVINMAIIDNIFDILQQKKDINWPSLWSMLQKKFGNNGETKERFDDYIPPHKNLGAIFIKAYYKAINSK